MSQINLPFSDLGQLGQPTADVINNLIDKFSSAVGWFVTPKGVKKAQIEAQKSIIDELAARTDIPYFQRAAIISDWNRVIKEYANQHDILEITIQNLSPDARPEQLDEEWLHFFADKSKFASKQETKIIWGKILAEECNHPDSISKSLINTLSLIDSKAALAFNQLASYVVINQANNVPVPIIPFTENSDYFTHIGLDFNTLTELDRHGLICFDGFAGYAEEFQTLDALYFDTTLFIHTSDKLLSTGNIMFTQDGQQLFNIVTREKSPKFIEIIQAFFSNRGIEISIK